MIQIASFLSLLIPTALVAFFARRILGAPIGWPRAIIVGVLMLSLLAARVLVIGTRHGLGGFLGRSRRTHRDRAQRSSVARALRWAQRESRPGRLSVNIRLLNSAADRLRRPQLAYGIGFYQILGYSLLFVGCVRALRALVLVFRRSWSP